MAKFTPRASQQSNILIMILNFHIIPGFWPLWSCDTCYITWYMLHHLIQVTSSDTRFITWYALYHLIHAYITWYALYHLIHVTSPDTRYIIWYMLHHLIHIISPDTYGTSPDKCYITWYILYHLINVTSPDTFYISWYTSQGDMFWQYLQGRKPRWWHVGHGGIRKLLYRIRG